MLILFSSKTHVMSKGEQQRKLERLRAVRGGNRDVIMKLCHKINVMLAEESFNTDPIKVAYLNIIHEQLDRKIKQFSNF